MNTLLFFILIIGIIGLARVFFRSRKKDGHMTMPVNPSTRLDGYPANNRLMTDPTFMFLGVNYDNYYYRHRGDD